MSDKTKRIGAWVLPWKMLEGERPDTRWEYWDDPELDSPRGVCYVRADIADALLAALEEIQHMSGPNTAGSARKVAREAIAKAEDKDGD